MQSRLSDFARAFLPLVPLAMCPGCGGGPQEKPAANVANTPVTAAAPTGNRAPTITGVAAKSAQVGNDYTFQPDWSDPDGDRLHFSATNLPPWAELDATTGRIHGTPAAADVGSYEAISITVADASHHVSTQEFSIAVVGTGTGVAELSWSAPLMKVDGSNLDNLAGFRILYGRDPQDLDHSVYIADPTAHSYEFATLDSGAWYFAIAAVADDGLEGPASTPAMKVI
jgi:hypothetical protein